MPNRALAMTPQPRKATNHVLKWRPVGAGSVGGLRTDEYQAAAATTTAATTMSGIRRPAAWPPAMAITAAIAVATAAPSVANHRIRKVGPEMFQPTAKATA